MSSPLMIERISTLIETLNNARNIYDNYPYPGAPANFQTVVCEAMNQSEVAIRALNTIKDQVDEQACSMLDPKIQLCQERAGRLRNLLHQMCTTEPESAMYPRYTAAVNSGKHERVEQLMLGILVGIQDVAAFKRVDILVAQVSTLKGAVETLSKAGSSAIPKEAPVTSYLHYGPGSQNAHWGSGNQNINNGAGEMYLGTHQTFYRVHNIYQSGSKSDSALPLSSTGGASSSGTTRTGTMAGQGNRPFPPETDEMTKKLYTAAGHGLKTRIQHMLENGANPNASVRGHSLLHTAAANGHTAIVSLLLEKGALVNVRTPGGQTPLHDSSYFGQRGATQVLLDKAAYVHAKTRDGRTALHYAAMGGHPRLIEILLDRKIVIDVANPDGWTPFLQAVHRGHLDCVRLLVERGANISAAINNESSALLLAAATDQCAVANYLLTRPNGPDVDQPNAYGWTALHMAADKGHLGMTRCLMNRTEGYRPIRKAANVNAQNELGQTALHLTARHNHLHVARCLISLRASVNARTNNLQCPLHWAANYGHSDMVKLLIANGAALEAKDNRGMTPATVAANATHHEIVLVLKAATGKARRSAVEKVRQQSLAAKAASAVRTAAAEKQEQVEVKVANTEPGSPPRDLAPQGSMVTQPESESESSDAVTARSKTSNTQHGGESKEVSAMTSALATRSAASEGNHAEAINAAVRETLPEPRSKLPDSMPARADSVGHTGVLLQEGNVALPHHPAEASRTAETTLKG